MFDNIKNKDYLTTTQAAKLLSVTPDTVLKWVKAGKIKSHRTLGGHFRIPLAAVQQYQSERLPSGEQPGPSLPAGASDEEKQLATHKYCWEFNSGNGDVAEECKECITYKSRSRRCYELRDLPDGLGCLRVYCQSTCSECDYYRLVSGQGLNVIVLSKNHRILRDSANLDDESGLKVRFAESEYECSLMIERFRPDYVVVDCSIGKSRASSVCENLFSDSRIPVARIVIASKSKEKMDCCDKEIFGWITKPFTLEQLKDCLSGAH